MDIPPSPSAPMAKSAAEEDGTILRPYRYSKPAAARPLAVVPVLVRRARPTWPARMRLLVPRPSLGTRSRRGADERQTRRPRWRAKSRQSKKKKKKTKCCRSAGWPYWWTASRTCARTYGRGRTRWYPPAQVPACDGQGVPLVAPEAVLVRCRSVEDEEKR